LDNSYRDYYKNKNKHDCNVKLTCKITVKFIRKLDAGKKLVYRVNQ